MAAASGHPKQVKKSIYVDEDLYAELKLSAERDGRSVTKQLNIFLRRCLFPHTFADPLWVPGVGGGDLTVARPDPKIKSSKKLT